MIKLGISPDDSFCVGLKATFERDNISGQNINKRNSRKHKCFNIKTFSLRKMLNEKAGGSCEEVSGRFGTLLCSVGKTNGCAWARHMKWAIATKKNRESLFLDCFVRIGH